MWDEVRAVVIPYPFGNGHPRFSAWVNSVDSPPHPLAAMAAGVAAAMNPSVAGGNHAAVHLEHQVVRWFCELLGWPRRSRRSAAIGSLGVHLDIARQIHRQTHQIRCSKALFPPGQTAHRSGKAEERLIHLLQYAVVYW